jgi:membrane protein required for beta-lactamase induction
VSLEPPYTEPLPRRTIQDGTDWSNALAGALAGVQLGAHDRIVLHWLTSWDNPIVATIASLIRRARIAAIAGAGMQRGRTQGRR